MERKVSLNRSVFKQRSAWTAFLIPFCEDRARVTAAISYLLHHCYQKGVVAFRFTVYMSTLLFIKVL